MNIRIFIELVLKKIELFIYFLFYNKGGKIQKKKLLLCHVDQIGDYIIFTNSLSRIRKMYNHNEWEITLVGLEEWENLIEINVKSKINWIDKFVSINKNNFFNNYLYRKNKFQEFINVKYHLVINTNSFRLILSDYICFVIFSNKKISIKKSNNILQILFNFSYSNQLKIELENLHEIKFYQTIFSRVTNFQIKDNNMFINWNKEDENFVKNLLNIQSPYILISAKSGNIKKDWPQHNYLRLINDIRRDYNIFLTGSHNQEKELDLLFNRYYDNKLSNVAGKLSLRQIAFLVSKSSIVISNDSMIAHMAIALKKPLLCIIPGTDYGRYFPYNFESEYQKIIHVNWDCFGCEWNCIYKVDVNSAFPCLSKLSYEKVIDEYMKLKFKNIT